MVLNSRPMKTKSTGEAWRLKVWRVPLLGKLELMHAAGLTHEYPRHIHEEHCLVVVLRGVETHTCRGESFSALPGSLMLLNANEAHSSRSNGSEYRTIHIGARALERIASEVAGRQTGHTHFPRPVVEDPPVFRALLKLHLKLEQNARNDLSLEQETELLAAIGLLLARHNGVQPASAPRGKEPRRLGLIQDFLKAHSAEHVSLSQLAAVAGLSPFHLLRVFRRGVGVPPHEYQTQLRVAHARRLLHDGRSISQAAHETGFFDQSHLSRNFKRIVGITPGRYLSRSNIVQDAAGRGR